ncbi:hypothetical protein LTR41_004739 [Exophiala xenobiotica]|nr:hypothetical protein LTR41_004739 [Exophiala xenobiotica]
MEKPFCSTPKSYDTGLFAEVPMVGSLLRQVDQLQESLDCDTVERLTEENEMLAQSVKRGRQRLLSVANVLREAFEGYVVLHAHIQSFEQETKELDAEWAELLPIGVHQNAGPMDRIQALILDN